MCVRERACFHVAVLCFTRRVVGSVACSLTSDLSDDPSGPVGADGDRRTFCCFKNNKWLFRVRITKIKWHEIFKCVLTSVALLVLRLVNTCIRFQQRLMTGVSQREKKNKLKDSWFLWLWWRWNKIILLSRWEMKHKGNKHILSMFCYYKKLQSSLLLQCFHFVSSQWEKKKKLKTLMRNFSFVASDPFSF